MISCTAHAQQNKKKVIGMIVPMHHAALEDIVSGYKEELAQLLPPASYDLQVLNAQGDLSLQMAIINNLAHNGCDIFVPIGTQTSQMTLKTVKTGSIVSLAANLEPDVQTQAGVIPITGVLDELSIEEQMQFLHSLFPEMKTCTLVYSGAEKVHKEAEQFCTYAKQANVQVQLLMAQNMVDLATVSKNIAKDASCIFVLKDHLIVSGIHLLAEQAKTLHIPLITSDEGSVKAGAALALGVQEKEIGKQGAKLTSRVFYGELASTIPIRTIDDVSLFINEQAMREQHVDEPQIAKVAQKLGYQMQKR
jgi:putative ABC transport system substrate-binding protein